MNTIKHITFVCITALCIGSSVFADDINNKPEKYNDPFIEMRAKIADFSSFIQEKEKDASCYEVGGKDLVAYYNLKNTPLLEKRASQEVIKGSVTYNKNINEIDDAIHAVVTDFSVSKHACFLRSVIIAEKKLSDILSYREKLLQKTQNNHSPLNIYKKENDNTDPNFFTFTETTVLFKNLMKKMDLIKKAATDLMDGEISPEYDFRLTDSERKRISQRGRERAEAYADDFIESAKAYVYLPILRSSTDIKKNLESLPDRRSEFDKYTYSVDFEKIISDMLSDPAKKQSIEKVEKNTHLNDTFRTPYTENSVVISKLTKKENLEYKKKLEEMMALEEKIALYDEPFSQAVVDSLIPFHITLLETERLLQYQTSNLEYVLNRHNVEVE